MHMYFVVMPFATHCLQPWEPWILNLSQADNTQRTSKLSDRVELNEIQCLYKVFVPHCAHTRCSCLQLWLSKPKVVVSWLPCQFLHVSRRLCQPAKKYLRLPRHVLSTCAQVSFKLHCSRIWGEQCFQYHSRKCFTYFAVQPHFFIVLFSMICWLHICDWLEKSGRVIAVFSSTRFRVPCNFLVVESLCDTYLTTKITARQWEISVPVDFMSCAQCVWAALDLSWQLL